MLKTQVRLGESKAYIIKKKSKFKPQNTGFCNSPSCLCEVQLDDSNRCMRCFNKVIQKQNFNATKKWFDNFIRYNENILNFEIDYSIVIQVPIHKRIYHVPIRYFVEFQNLPESDDFIINKNLAYQNFFECIKKTCYSIVMI